MIIILLNSKNENPFKDKNKDFSDENEIRMMHRYERYFGFGLLVLSVIIGMVRFIKFYI